MKIMITLLTAMVFMTVPLFGQDEEPSPSWSLSAGTRYLSRFINYGLDLSQDKPALGYDVGLDHEDGLSADWNAIQTLGTGGMMQQWSAGVGYDWQVSDQLVLSAAYTYYQYNNDSVSVLASLQHGLSFSAELSAGEVDIGFSYDTFLGGNSASYYGVNMSGFYEVGDLVIVPFVQLTLMSQEVEERLLKPSKNPRSGPTSSSTVTTVTGISSFSIHLVAIYPLVDRLVVTLHPSYVYSPRAEVAARTSQVVWSAGVRYHVDF